MTITQDPHQTPVGDPSEEPAPSSSSSTTSTASTPPQDTAQDIQNNSSDSEEDGAVPSEDEDEDEDTRADLDDLEDTPQPPPTASATPIVDALRAQLAELGLSTKGNKQTLKKRLRAAKKKSVGAKKERLDLAWEENVERHAGHGWGWDGKASSGGDDEEEDGDEGDDEDRPERF
ncbi:hypothetical protein HK102_001044 [Quaeritorhiza haematococci]|nr:hypothetical protein HK102_001044 [Quaeritorhiza haematococci]